MNAPLQLPLQMHWPAHARFEHFIVGSSAPAMRSAQQLASTPSARWLHVSGPVASGKTHLLLASCQHAQSLSRQAMYLSLTQTQVIREDLWKQLDGIDMVCIDDVDQILADAQACAVMFSLYNRLSDRGASLMVATRQNLAGLPIALADLRSRLAAMNQATLKALDESGQRELLRQRGSARGIELSEPVLNYLFSRAPRQLPVLLGLLEQLDRQSLVRQRAISVPMVRELLAAQPPK